MTRYEHLIKAGDALSQMIAHLQAAGADEDGLHGNTKFRDMEKYILDLIDTERLREWRATRKTCK